MCDPKCGQREVANVQRGAAAQLDGAVAAPSGPPGRAGSFDVGGGDELPAAENTLSGSQFCGAVAALSGPVCRACSVGVRKGHARHFSRDALVAQRFHSGGGQRQVCCWLWPASALRALRRVLVLIQMCCSLAVSRIHLHELHGSTLHSIRIHIVHLHVSCMMCMLHAVVRGRGVCVLGRTKSLSTSTRCGVRRSAVFESAHSQQTPLKLHEETWAGLLRNQGPKIFREVEIVPGWSFLS